MEIDKSEVTVFNNKLNMLQNQFLIAMDRYRSALKEQYLEGKDTSANSENAQNLINEIYSNAFILTGEVNSNIIRNNEKIESLDDYLTKLKKEVDMEKKMLKISKESEKGAVPRKEDLKELMTLNYVKSGLYLSSIIGSSYLIYKFMS